MERRTEIVRTLLGSHQSAADAIIAEWNIERHQQMDWLGMENVLRNILRNYSTEPDCIAIIDDCIAAFTRRGHELPESK